MSSKKSKSKNLEKVAQGNDEDDYAWPSALSAYERGENPCPPLDEVVVGAMDYWPPDNCSCTGPPINEIDPNCLVHKGCCKTCGCPPEYMPMIFRGTGWCSDAHRKEQQKKES